MAESSETYKAIIKDLQAKVKQLREEKLELEDKFVETLSTQRAHYMLTVSIPPDEERIYRVVKNFIQDAKTELIIVSKTLSSDILDMIIEKIGSLKTITVVTSERHQIHVEDNLKSFDTLASIPQIHHLMNSNVNSTFLIKDNEEVLLLSSKLVKAELTTLLNTGFKLMDPKIVETFFKFYKDHLPSFMR